MFIHTEWEWATGIETKGFPVDPPEEPHLSRFALDKETALAYIWIPEQQKWLRYSTPIRCSHSICTSEMLTPGDLAHAP